MNVNSGPTSEQSARRYTCRVRECVPCLGSALADITGNAPAGCVRARSLSPADRVWARSGATFRIANGRPGLPPASPYGGRVRDVPPQRIPAYGADHAWRRLDGRSGRQPRLVLLLGGGQRRAGYCFGSPAGRCPGVAPLIEALAEHNGVRDRVHVEVAVIGGTRTSGSRVGVISDDQRWSASSHGAPDRPAGVSVPS